MGSIKTLAINIYKTLHSLNPNYISEILKENSIERSQLRSKNNLTIRRYDTVTFGINSIRILGQKIWNNLAREFKTAEDLKTTRIFLRQWHGPQCDCNLCKYSN